MLKKRVKKEGMKFNSSKWMILILSFVVVSLIVSLISLNVLYDILGSGNGLKGELASLSDCDDSVWEIVNGKWLEVCHDYEDQDCEELEWIIVDGEWVYQSVCGDSYDSYSDRYDSSTEYKLDYEYDYLYEECMNCFESLKVFEDYLIKKDAYALMHWKWYNSARSDYYYYLYNNYGPKKYSLYEEREYIWKDSTLQDLYFEMARQNNKYQFALNELDNAFNTYRYYYDSCWGNYCKFVFVQNKSGYPEKYPEKKVPSIFKNLDNLEVPVAYA